MTGLQDESVCSIIPSASRILAISHSFFHLVVKSAGCMGGELQVQAGERLCLQSSFMPAYLSENFGTLLHHSNTITIDNDNNDFLQLYDILPCAECLCIDSFFFIVVKCTI